MNNNLNENKNIAEVIAADNKKAKSKFNVILLIAMIIGFFSFSAVIALKYFHGSNPELAETINKYASALYGPVALVIAIIMTVICIAITAKANKLFKKWDGENEQDIERCESLIHKSTTLLQVQMIVVYGLFGLQFISYAKGNMTNDAFFASLFAPMMFGLLGMCITIIFNMSIQRRNVDLNRLINPEKQGSYFDLKLVKKLEESSDEAEKLVMYRAGYRAFRTMNAMFLVAWIVIILAGVAFEVSIVPMIMVTVMWLISTIVYCAETKKKA